MHLMPPKRWTSKRCSKRTCPMACPRAKTFSLARVRFLFSKWDRTRRMETPRRRRRVGRCPHRRIIRIRMRRENRRPTTESWRRRRPTSRPTGDASLISALVGLVASAGAFLKLDKKKIERVGALSLEHRKKAKSRFEEDDFAGIWPSFCRGHCLKRLWPRHFSKEPLHVSWLFPISDLATTFLGIGGLLFSISILQPTESGIQCGALRDIEKSHDRNPRFLIAHSIVISATFFFTISVCCNRRNEKSNQGACPKCLFFFRFLKERSNAPRGTRISMTIPIEKDVHRK